MGIREDTGILKSFFRDVRGAIGEQTARINEAAVRLNRISGSNLAERGALASSIDPAGNFNQIIGFNGVGHALGGLLIQRTGY